MCNPLLQRTKQKLLPNDILRLIDRNNVGIGTLTAFRLILRMQRGEVDG